ncbi:TlpA family protein disulfide reductase [Colwellia psychrerythraea]|uniref:Alkyl hydroperoxide reductase/ Thiol specific antioxidant/ Mal allergen n=1 Tax=Colwellia psychrerythraea TaxID=28229 RepID=A0A099KW96_COLPS|nr:TlpA disulfide reductase family protein [Colwellia psychrerythraea]KGJ95014.1 alkyl hydroperoxide reductase/ Thiol specific antioxidant/ Mal allergen [Colwellia psychrerythraea]
MPLSAEIRTLQSSKLRVFSLSATIMKSLLVSLLLFATNANALELGKPAPDFTLKSMAGTNLKLAEQRGKIIVINFWASWCGPCRKEMPVLQKFYNKYQDLGVSVWGINVEQENQAGRDFLADLNLSFPILFDASNTISATYQVEAMPTTIIVDRDGLVRYAFKGYKPGYEKKYAKAIKKLIRE